MTFVEVSFIFQLICLALLIYGIEYRVYARERYDKLDKKKLNEYMMMPYEPEITVHCYNISNIETICLSRRINERQVLNMQTLSEGYVERKVIERAKKELMEEVINSDQFIEVEKETDAFGYQHTYYLTLRILRKK